MSCFSLCFLFAISTRTLFDDVADLTIQNKAQAVERLSGDRQSFFHSVQGVGRDTLFKDQMVFRDILFDERLIKWFVRNQVDHLL